MALSSKGSRNENKGMNKGTRTKEGGWAASSSVSVSSKESSLCRVQAFYVEAIHSHCTVLLATLCVATAPLEAVYRDFKCGYPEPSPNADLVAFSPWLAWARPGLFQWPPWARPLPSVAVWVPVAMCLASPRPDPQLVVRVIRARSVGTLKRNRVWGFYVLHDKGHQADFCGGLRNNFEYLGISFVVKPKSRLNGAPSTISLSQVAAPLAGVANAAADIFLF